MVGDKLVVEVFAVNRPKEDQVEESVSSRMVEGSGPGDGKWSAGEWTAEVAREAASPPRSPQSAANIGGRTESRAAGWDAITDWFHQQSTQSHRDEVGGARNEMQRLGSRRK